MHRSWLLFVALSCAASPASATNWVFACPPSCAGSDGAGAMLSSEIRFDDAAEDLEWRASFAPNGEGRAPGGFWAVFTDGPAPRQAAGGLAILYGDAASGDVWAYAYDPALGRSTWRDSERFLIRFEDAVRFDHADGVISMHLALNVSPLHSPDPALGLGSDWRGIDLGPGIGVSSQFFAGTLDGGPTRARDSGELLRLDLGSHTSWGRHGRLAQPIPEPRAVLVFAVGLAVVGWGAQRARRRAA